jgi:hypothetical protein
MLPDTITPPHCPTALVYETTEEARVLLEGDGELRDARCAAGEAAYYLSDTMDPDERAVLLALAESRPSAAQPGTGTERAAEALSLLSDAVEEVEQMLRGPDASSELRIARRALRRGIGVLARRLRGEAGRLDPAARNRVLRRLRTGP